MKYDQLILKQVDNQLKDWNHIKNQKQPEKGWLEFIRKTLGLSSYKLSKMLKLNQSRVIQAEKSEQSGKIKLQTLVRFAEALDCKLVYGIVPKTSLEETIVNQAHKVAKKRIARVAHSMRLEAQGLDHKVLKNQVDIITKELLDGPLKKLWSDEE
jgi:predicted DNA-binding mobile mystery protein A